MNEYEQFFQILNDKEKTVLLKLAAGAIDIELDLYDDIFDLDTSNEVLESLRERIETFMSNRQHP